MLSILSTIRLNVSPQVPIIGDVFGLDPGRKITPLIWLAASTRLNSGAVINLKAGTGDEREYRKPC